MFLHLHPAMLVVGLLSSLFCILALAVVADTRGQTKLHAVWGMLALPGLVIGLLIMLALTAAPSNPPPAATVR